MTKSKQCGIIDVIIAALVVLIMPMARADAYDIFTKVTGMVVQEYDWAATDWSQVPGGKPANATVVPAGDDDPAKMQIRMNPPVASQPEKVEQRTTLLVIDKPSITATDYALSGTIAYRDVTGSGYLEMLSMFPDGNEYFSRGLQGEGLTGRIEGTSGWRKFALPFHAKPGHVPTRLVLNLVMVGGGTVELGPVRLVDQARISGGEGVLGGILGTALGCLGGTIGVLGGIGRARRLVITLMWFMAASGLTLAALGVGALLLGYCFGVYYPLILSGVIASVLGFALIPIVRRRYQEAELRRMQALDAVGK